MDMGRRELLDVPHAIAGSFVSRNNDVDGYWSLGLLRSFADRNQVWSLQFDLVNGATEPEATLLGRVAAAYRSVLVRQLTTRGIARGVVAKALVVLTFNPDAPHTPSIATEGAPFSCTVLLTDHRGRDFERILIGHCAPHDPRRELRSTRAQDRAQ
jgi:hypothetical protein